MKLTIDHGVAVFLRQFTLGLFIFTVANVVIYCIQQVLGGFTIDESLPWSFWEIIVICFILSFMMLSKSLYIAKAVMLSDKEPMVEMMTRALKRMKWKQYSQKETEFIFCSPSILPIWKERIVVRITDTELQIYGPRESIEKAINYANFPYGVFEINKFNLNEEYKN